MSKPHAIICEGKDAKLFIQWYLVYLKGNNPKYGNFESLDGRGIDQLEDYVFNYVRTPEFRKTVKSVTLLRDYEYDEHKNPEQAIKGAFTRSGLSVPEKPFSVAYSENISAVRTAYGLFPIQSLNSNGGTLEDFCLQILIDSNKDRMEITEQAISAANMQLGRFEKPYKNKFHAYLSLTDKFVGCKLGEAANFGAFDFESPALLPLRQLLDELLCE